MDEGAFRHLAHRWGRQNAVEAATWAIEKEDPSLLLDVVSSSSDHQLSALGEWLSTHENNPNFSNVASAFADRIAGIDPDSSEKWKASATSQ